MHQTSHSCPKNNYSTAYRQAEFFWYAAELATSSWMLKWRLSWRNLHKVVTLNNNQFHHMYWRKRLSASLCSYLHPKAHYVLWDFVKCGVCFFFSTLCCVQFGGFGGFLCVCDHPLPQIIWKHLHSYVSTKTNQVFKNSYFNFQAVWKTVFSFRSSIIKLALPA